MRGGEDVKLPRDAKTKRTRHTVANVYREMLLQICSDFPGVGSLMRTLTMDEIRFFYEGGRASLKEATKPRKKTPMRRK